MLLFMKINSGILAFAAVSGVAFVALCAANPVPERTIEPTTQTDAAVIAPNPKIDKNASMKTAVEATYDEAVAVLKNWDASFQRPPIKYYDGDVRIDGESFDDDGAAWYDGKIYIDLGTFFGSTTDGNFYYTIGHELGHGWEENVDPGEPASTKSEMFGDCISGAIAADADWDYEAMADYTRSIGTVDKLHGTAQQRYDKVIEGATEGHRGC
jgi:hypothetical protein